MTSLTIRNVDHVTRQTLPIRVARHGVSMEEVALIWSGAPAKPGRRLLVRFHASASDEFVLSIRQIPRDAL